MGDRLKPRRRIFLLYLAPPLLLFVFTTITPIFYAFYYSFFKWMGGPQRTFDGLTNYIQLARDQVFWQSFRNNLFLTLFSIVGQIGIAFLLACMLNSRLARFKRLHRTLCYFPVTISAVVVGFVWSMIYDYNFGLLNSLLAALGRPELRQAWLSNQRLALGLVGVPIVWQYIGYYMVILLSAFTSIDPGIFEMAEIDGAGGLQRAVHIALPMLRPTFAVMVTLCISGNMKTFDHVYVMTGGGPGATTSVMALYAYNTSFLRSNMGYGSAMSVGILVLSMAVILGARLLLRLAARGRGDQA